MPEKSPCRFCNTETVDRLPAIEMVVCENCAESTREIVSEYLPDSITENPFGFEPIDHETTAKGNELVYLSPKNQYYELDLRNGDDGQTLYLQPVPQNKPSFPITDIQQTVQTAIEDGDFYKVSRTPAAPNSEDWWETALAFAPTPDEIDDEADMVFDLTDTEKDTEEPDRLISDGGWNSSRGSEFLDVRSETENVPELLSFPYFGSYSGAVSNLLNPTQDND